MQLKTTKKYQNHKTKAYDIHQNKKNDKKNGNRFSKQESKTTQIGINDISEKQGTNESTKMPGRTSKSREVHVLRMKKVIKANVEHMKVPHNISQSGRTNAKFYTTEKEPASKCGSVREKPTSLGKDLLPYQNSDRIDTTKNYISAGDYKFAVSTSTYGMMNELRGKGQIDDVGAIKAMDEVLESAETFHMGHDDLLINEMSGALEVTFGEEGELKFVNSDESINNSIELTAEDVPRNQNNLKIELDLNVVQAQDEIYNKQRHEQEKLNYTSRLKGLDDELSKISEKSGEEECIDDHREQANEVGKSILRSLEHTHSGLLTHSTEEREYSNGVISENMYAYTYDKENTANERMSEHVESNANEINEKSYDTDHEGDEAKNTAFRYDAHNTVIQDTEEYAYHSKEAYYAADEGMSEDTKSNTSEIGEDADVTGDEGDGRINAGLPYETKMVEEMRDLNSNSREEYIIDNDEGNRAQSPHSTKEPKTKTKAETLQMKSKYMSTNICL